MDSNELHIPVNGVELIGVLTIPDHQKGMVIFSHGSGSSRLSPRNGYVAEELQKHGFVTLLFDLLTPDEDKNYNRRFDIDHLSDRLTAVTKWIKLHPDYGKWHTGFFGASTGAASALRSAVELGSGIIKTVVSRGRRPDLASDVLEIVECPVLLLVGSDDTTVLDLNKKALDKLNCTKKLITIPGATHLFEEPGKMEEVTEKANEWFEKYLYRIQIGIDKDFMK